MRRASVAQLVHEISLKAFKIDFFNFHDFVRFFTIFFHLNILSKKTSFQGFCPDVLYSLFDFYGYGFFLQKTPFSFIYHFDFNLVNSFSRRTVQNPNTSDVGKNQSQI